MFDKDNKYYKEEDKKNFNTYCKNYKYYPLILPARKDNEQIIVIGDIHGDYHLAIEVLLLANVIDKNNKWIGGNTIVVQVGDQVDGCRPLNKKCDEEPSEDLSSYSGSTPEDIKVLNFFTDLNIEANKQGGMVISLLGNHELMNVMGNANYVSYKDLHKFKNYYKVVDPNIVFKDVKDYRIDGFKPGHEYAKMLACTRLPCVIIGSYLFVHAGFIKKFIDKFKFTEQSDLYAMNYVLREWLLGLIDKNNVVNIINSKPYSPFWDRILGAIPPNMNNDDPRCIEHLDSALKVFDVKSMFIGHTPQNFAHNSYINKTCGNKLWRVDFSGSHAFNKFDPEFNKSKLYTNLRKAQVLRIYGDNNEPEVLI